MHTGGQKQHHLISKNDEDGVLKQRDNVFLISADEVGQVLFIHPCQGADPGGGVGAGVPWPPPHFLGEKQGGKKTHTEFFLSKSDSHEARYRLKVPQNTPNTLKFSKKNYCEVGGLRGHKGKYFVHKSNKE